MKLVGSALHLIGPFFTGWGLPHSATLTASFLGFGTRSISVQEHHGGQHWAEQFQLDESRLRTTP